RDAAEIPNASKSSVENHLKALGYVSELDGWTPRQLEEVRPLKRVIVRDSLLKREENDLFLKRVITDDEKWIVYSDIEWKKSWSKRDEPKHFKSRDSSEEGCVVNLVGLGRHRVF
ncbi:Histone-lysine N-methyltransferase SETMAR, partial [Melipona quadrifasciata]